jgi:hypothetical protein
MQENAQHKMLGTNMKSEAQNDIAKLSGGEQ